MFKTRVLTQEDKEKYTDLLSNSLLWDWRYREDGTAFEAPNVAMCHLLELPPPDEEVGVKVLSCLKNAYHQKYNNKVDIYSLTEEEDKKLTDEAVDILIQNIIFSKNQLWFEYAVEKYNSNVLSAFKFIEPAIVVALMNNDFSKENSNNSLIERLWHQLSLKVIADNLEDIVLDKDVEGKSRFEFVKQLIFRGVYLINTPGFEDVFNTKNITILEDCILGKFDLGDKRLNANLESFADEKVWSLIKRAYLDNSNKGCVIPLSQSNSPRIKI